MLHITDITNEIYSYCINFLCNVHFKSNTNIWLIQTAHKPNGSTVNDPTIIETNDPY